MKGDSGYALQKLDLSIVDLATGPGNIRTRLNHIFINHLHVINVNDFPEELKKDWENIINSLTKKGAVKDEQGEIIIGSVENTLKHIRNKTGSAISKDIVTLSDKLRGYFEDVAENNP